MSNTKLLVILMGACAAVALPVGAFYLNPVLIIAGAIALIAMFVFILSLVARAYVAKKDAERVLAYKALGHGATSPIPTPTPSFKAGSIRS